MISLVMANEKEIMTKLVEIIICKIDIRWIAIFKGYLIK
jgi:hypothetical protein